MKLKRNDEQKTSRQILFVCIRLGWRMWRKWQLNWIIRVRSAVANYCTYVLMRRNVHVHPIVLYCVYSHCVCYLYVIHTNVTTAAQNILCCSFFWLLFYFSTVLSEGQSNYAAWSTLPRFFLHLVNVRALTLIQMFVHCTMDECCVCVCVFCSLMLEQTN